MLGWLVALTAPRDFSVGNFVDDAHYAVLAKALREQGAYRTLNLPDTPRETKYPPGFPSLLALVWSPDRTDPANLDALRWVNLSLVGALAAALAVLATTNPGLHYLSLGVHTVPGHRMRSYRAYRLGHWSTAWGQGDDLWDIVRRYQPGFVLVERVDSMDAAPRGVSRGSVRRFSHWCGSRHSGNSCAK